MVSPLWIVSRDGSAPPDLTEGLAGLAPLAGVRFADYPGHRFPRGATVLFDVDLADIEVVLAVRSGLRAQEAVRSLFAVDARVRRQYVQADALGAAAVVERPLGAEAVLKALKRLDGPAAAQGPAARGPAGPAAGAAGPGRTGPGARPGAARPAAPGIDPRQPAQSVGVGGAVLTRLFDNVLGGGGFDPASVERAAVAIGESVDVVGLDTWLRTMREHHTGTFMHCLTVTGLATRFAARLGFDEEQRRLFTTASLLHDIGKARVPAQILDKPGKLTEAEFTVVKRHPGYGARYLTHQGSIDPRILDMVLHHHEYLDGSGYPDGLNAALIPPLTRALTVSDVFGALIEERSYKPPMPPEKAQSILEAMVAEGRLDGDLVRAFAKVAADVGPVTAKR